MSVQEKELLKQSGSASNYLWSDPPDPNKWADCVHCGLCLESCPTYEVLGQEQHSPRGRVYLIKSVAEGRLVVDENFADPVNVCLDCRACTTACPSDVNVGGLVEEARGQIRQAMPMTGWKKAVSDYFLEGVFPNPKRMQRLGSLLKFYQKSGLQKAARKTGALNLLPKHLAEMESILPEIGEPVRKKYKNVDYIKAKGKAKRRVAILTGCVMDVMFADVNESTINVLTRNGNEVEIPEGQTCCGALHVHAGDREMGRKLAKQNIEAFKNCDTIIVNAAGCGAMLKEYPELFKDDPEWKEKAEEFSKKIEDISEFLYKTGYEKPKGEIRGKVTYHDACHLAHAQGIREQPRSIIKDIPGLEIVPMANSDRCCGSAGIYNLTQPEMAEAILENKMKNVPENAEMIIMGNPGCMLQMSLGAKKHGNNQKIVHTVQLLDWSYKQEEKGGKDDR